MKSFVILATLASLSLAAPAGLIQREECPAIPQIAPNGQLPPGTLHPALLLPVSQKHPDKAFPGGQSAIVTPNDFCTLTRIDIPAANQNKTCSLSLFLGCGQEYEKGPGNIIFQGNTGKSFPIAGQTTWNNKPAFAPPFTDAPLIQLQHAYRLGGGPCDFKAGQAFASVGGMICSKDTTLSFTQSNGGHGKCPVGFHIIVT
ncbi:hypothetical protein BCR34DRAFT_588756 [Clohesyomyces aquaticus]|uniref:Ubiquitin 3 binding protein But2 C-terminal domain-containing protein n=1 Tax=Clohesyomyces aquaticus TaxID=1231657 RepID=A0A1Y1ZJ88_9PLEO|nr:hypothetical protein BCR34DRAFT_588756 [Clohesyomyces aquaticus]